MKDIIKRIGFKENKKCRCCDNMAWYQVASSALCEQHMEGFLEFKEDLMNFQEENK